MMLLLWVLIFAAIAYKAWQYFQWKTAELSFASKTVFITGGSSGIGEAMTKRLVQLGAKKVVIASRNVKEMERVKNECIDTNRVEIMQMDLSKPEECLERVKNFVQNSGEVDIVINNAGITMREEFQKTEFETCKMMMNTNCMSHIAITKGFLPLLIK